MDNPTIGETFLLLGKVEHVVGDESTDIAHRTVTLVLDDGQRIQTNLRNLMDPRIVVQAAEDVGIVEIRQEP